jgi:hypothetical protein
MFYAQNFCSKTCLKWNPRAPEHSSILDRCPFNLNMTYVVLHVFVNIDSQIHAACIHCSVFKQYSGFISRLCSQLVY